jgi:DNA-binding NarL/FixJ family response regulator
VVDDHTMITQLLATTLANSPNIEVVGTAATAAAGVLGAKEHQPDVILLDFLLPDADGTDTVGQIIDAAPDTRVLVITGAADERVVQAAIDSGCAGVIDKASPLSELVTAVETVHNGGAVFPPDLLARALPRLQRGYRGLGSDLTRREKEILAMMAEGASNRGIADELVISLHTVRNHVQNVLTKLGAHSKTEAVAIARRERILNR